VSTACHSEIGFESVIVAHLLVPLSQPINLVHDRFGTEFSQTDQLFFDQIVEAALTDRGLRQAAAVKSEDKCELVFQNLLERLFVERINQGEEMVVRYINDVPFREVVSRWMAPQAYKRLRSTEPLSQPGMAP
jgi:type I restriction enzyme R subunit